VTRARRFFSPSPRLIQTLSELFEGLLYGGEYRRQTLSHPLNHGLKNTPMSPLLPITLAIKDSADSKGQATPRPGP